MAGEKAALLHADPPYGMGKESQGVANDNIYGAELDGFHLLWWGACRPHLIENASVYIWGNAPDLWRLWYAAGLGESEEIDFKNEIVWDKGAGQGQALNGRTQYATATERCLFFAIGKQYRGNVNNDDFPVHWAPVQGYLASEASAAGIVAGDIKRICGVSMYSHWFSRSQFQLIPSSHYERLQNAFPGSFVRSWKDLKAEWDRVKSEPTAKAQLERSFFDNTHDSMNDVWRYERVAGAERHGHATPKPVSMIERIIRSSCRENDLLIEPFGGSGTTFVAAAQAGRRCYGLELEPRYVACTLERLTAMGLEARLL